MFSSNPVEVAYTHDVLYYVLKETSKQDARMTLKENTEAAYYKTHYEIPHDAYNCVMQRLL